jgi:hypothetical protein
MGIVLGINKFFNSDFDPFNACAIGKIPVLFNDESGISFGLNVGYGIFNDKYETAEGTFKANNVYSTKFFVKFELNLLIGMAHLFPSPKPKLSMRTEAWPGITFSR